MAIEYVRRPGGRRTRVLVTGDARALRLLIREVLEEARYRPSLAASALDVGAIKRHAPDLLVLDPTVGPADRDWRILRRLRVDPATTGLLVVL